LTALQAASGSLGFCVKDANLSGPKTVLLSPAGLPILMAAAGIRAIEAIQEANARAEALKIQHANDREERSDAQRIAREQAIGAAHREIKTAEDRLDVLMNLAKSLNADAELVASRPQAPDADDIFSLAGYASGLKIYTDQVELILLQESARLKSDRPLDAPELDAAREGHEPQRIAKRLMARIAHLGDAPTDIRQLAQELDQLLPGERSLLVAAELRLKIQTYLDHVQARMIEEATATVIAQSLKDLGYQVEDIPNTLFVDGGITHFQKPGWGDYMVRMRVAEKGGTANFNVVRAIDGQDQDITVMDRIAEDRWCAEFPTLLKKLETEGIHLQVTRHLQAGELPVQLVERARLPAFKSDEGEQKTSAPISLPIR
jgi:hypothetical protein